ncbi:hypothetical protein SH601_13305 [Gracilibacillus sp. S3-1-1]|uniref:Uncharacterized protein n=1 Tax=Gracilibacillus pellucidus TaxID=3095368 RepID=A0ACC6M7K8_9BACI|nr:hypothetical protein [Gracilibacillus sp. S3-1-1]MDX8046965.1 hypothetical protein [Gracilibacillus sp. S3-1-1]
MIYILLMISFIIHIITFVIIRQMKVNHDKTRVNDSDINEQIKNMEDTLAVYLVELKEENANFVKQIEQLQQRKNEANSTNNEQKQSFVEKTSPQPISETPDKSTNNFQPITDVENVEDVVEKSTTATALHLQEQGYTLEEIAKKLDKGKTEIALLLKFQQKK